MQFLFTCVPSSKTCPSEQPNLFGSVPKKQVKKYLQSAGWAKTGWAWRRPCGPTSALPGQVKPSMLFSSGSSPSAGPHLR